ncbi:MAG: hypothetical protein ACI9S9_001503 [Planctomycetota bacterium]
MHLRFLTTVLLACTSITAQQTLSTQWMNGVSTAAGGAMYFTLTTGSGAVTITQFDLNFTVPAGNSGTMHFYTAPGGHVGNETNAGAWMLETTSQVLSSNAFGTLTPCVLNSPFFIPPNTSIGIAVFDVTMVLAQNMRYAPQYPFTYSECGLTLDAGGASHTPFTGGVFQGRTINTTVHYSANGSCAQLEGQGDGCTNSSRSFYEVLSPAAFDLSNTNVIGSFNGSSYVVTSAPGVGILPTGAIGSATTLALTDDGQVATGTLGLSVGSNGWITLGPGNSNQWSPTAALFLNNPSSAIAAWTDLQPNLSGIVSYEEDPTTGQTRTTFDAVFGWGTTNPNDIQFDYNTITQDFAIRFGVIAATNPEAFLVGYSPGGPSSDPGAFDISAATPANAIVTSPTDEIPLELTVERPVMVATATPLNATTSNLPATSLFHVGTVGLQSPTLPLSNLGLPSDCYLHVSPDVLIASVIAPQATSVTWTAVTLPAATPALNGFEFYIQSAVLDASVFSNSMRVSNAFHLTLGDA